MIQISRYELNANQDVKLVLLKCHYCVHPALTSLFQLLDFIVKNFLKKKLRTMEENILNKFLSLLVVNSALSPNLQMSRMNVKNRVLVCVQCAQIQKHVRDDTKDSI